MNKGAVCSCATVCNGTWGFCFSQIFYIYSEGSFQWKKIYIYLLTKCCPPITSAALLGTRTFVFSVLATKIRVLYAYASKHNHIVICSPMWQELEVNKQSFFIQRQLPQAVFHHGLYFAVVYSWGKQTAAVTFYFSLNGRYLCSKNPLSCWCL